MTRIANIISILIANFSVLESNLKSPRRWCYRIFGSVLSPSTGYGCEHLGSLFSSFWRHTKRLIREHHHACSMLAPLCRVSVYLPPPPFSQSSHFQLFDNWEKPTDTTIFSSHMSDLYEMISKFWEQDIFSQNFAENWGKFRQRLTFPAFSLSQHYEERYTNK